MTLSFDDAFNAWQQADIASEKNPRRCELLKKGLNYSTIAFLRNIWYPTIGNFNDLYPEYEVRDLDNKYRYLDLAYMPGGVKGCIEIQDYRSHARDIESERFKDLCMKQSALVLDDWLFLPIAYLSIRDDPAVCKKLILSFVGKFLSININPMKNELNWAEAESLRFARGLIRPFEAKELALHLNLSENRTRVLLRSLVSKGFILVASGKQRYRTFILSEDY